ncbi:MAG: membrane protein insertase YidC [Hyphomonadaceae bacterium]|nr:membrane protein insertase YidC [Hyphomonadaceae bacterium]
MIIAIALSIAIMAGWEFFVTGPQRAALQREQAAIEAQQAETAQQQQQQASEDAGSALPPSAPREEVIQASAARRIRIDTPTLEGSISLDGARIDDLSLRGYCRTIERNEAGGCVGGQAGEVTLLAPRGSQHGHDAFFGWEGRAGEGASTLADSSSAWIAPEGATLTPTTPLVLTLALENGMSVQRTIAIDDNYMLTITDTVSNPTGAAINVRPFGTVRRQGVPEDYKFNAIVHQGMVGAFGPNNRLQQTSFRDADKHAREKLRGDAGEDERIREASGQGGWLGLTDHYWLTAIVLDPGETMSAYYDSRSEDNETDYRAAYRGEWREVPAGGEITYTQRLFAGAKRVDLLQGYQDNFDIPRFDDAVDWGNFWFLTRPFFLWLLHPLAKLLGGFGWGILATTIVVKAALFPLVYQSMKSMAKMRALQPKMKELQERYAADKQRQQQELLKLYQTEKINPVSGCLPLLLQIPVFFALYKTLTVTIEMRQAPFVGWVHDLSAPDPTSIFNLFGLLRYNPADLPLLGAFLMIGVWPILYGVSMWILQHLSPPATDPLQASILRLMPILFTFMFAGFPAGLVIYWTWSNTLSILQQYVIMRRQGVETQFDIWLKKLLKREPATAG